MRSIAARFSEGVVEDAIVVAGRLTATLFWAAVSTVASGFWTLLGVPQEVLDKKNGDDPTVDAHVRAFMLHHLGEEILVACAAVLLFALVCSLAWLLFVWWNPPASPLQATRYRTYWFAGLFVLLAATIVFALAALYMPALAPRFPQIRSSVLPGWKNGLIGVLALSAFVFWYLMSLWRTPPTVIAAVPLGSFVARLRWR
jgi:hypothetical protein